MFYRTPGGFVFYLFKKNDACSPKADTVVDIKSIRPKYI